VKKIAVSYLWRAQDAKCSTEVLVEFCENARSCGVDLNSEEFEAFTYPNRNPMRRPKSAPRRAQKNEM
jgi:hypothetical protein